MNLLKHSKSCVSAELHTKSATSMEHCSKNKSPEISSDSSKNYFKPRSGHRSKVHRQPPSSCLHIPPSKKRWKAWQPAQASPIPKFSCDLFPGMFHCTGITASGKATADGALYHVRVLDYSAAATLQHTAILAIVEPQNGYAFLNVTYAGFVGSVTGMNQEKIAIGEIGGKGYGSWNGLPMAFLLRKILEEASSIEEIKISPDIHSAHLRILLHFLRWQDPGSACCLCHSRSIGFHPPVLL